MKTSNSKEKVRQLQNKLYLTAKKCNSRRFHALYDKVYRDDILIEAWKRVKANKGSSGVDGIKIEDIEAMGIEKYLSEIKSELKEGKYKPSPVKRVMIPKPDGSERPLGIPTVKDRIVQMATKIAIEPVFEADFRDCSYGFRPKRSAKHALNLLRYIMEKLDLKLHPVKTKIVSMWDGKEGFDFLGMHHRRMTTETSKGQLYKETYQYPSRKAMKKMKAEIKRNVNSRSLLVAQEEDLIRNLNPKITGWKNYYSTKTNAKWMQAIDWYIICTFTRWYNKKYQRRNRMSKVGFVRNSIYEKGLKKMARA